MLDSSCPSQTPLLSSTTHNLSIDQQVLIEVVSLDLFYLLFILPYYNFGHSLHISHCFNFIRFKLGGVGLSFSIVVFLCSLLDGYKN